MLLDGRRHPCAPAGELGVSEMTDASLKQSRLLLVDDDKRNLQLLEAILRQAGYAAIQTVTDSRATLQIVQEWKPDLLVLDLNMPNLDGFGVLRQLKPLVPEDDYFPILMLTAEMSPEAKHEALAGGAKDFLTKPIDQTEVRLRIKNLLETRALHLQLRSHNDSLDRQVRARTAELEEAQVDSLRRLAMAAEYRDDVTGLHTWRVGELAALVTAELGWTATQQELIKLAAPLHDVGKIAIPDRILLKVGKFTTEEFESMKHHIRIGAELLSGSRSPLLQLAEVIARTHHERWDGTGYLGLQKEEIPLPGRIVTLADVFDALTHERPYKSAWPLELARDEIKRQAGHQFDPELVEHFLRVVDREGEALIQKSRPRKLVA